MHIMSPSRDLFILNHREVDPVIPLSHNDYVMIYFHIFTIEEIRNYRKYHVVVAKQCQYLGIV